MELGTRLTAWRKALGLTQRQLAEAAGVTTSAVSYWETGATTPGQKHLLAIVEFMKLTMSAFYGSVPKPKKPTKKPAPKRAAA